MSFPGTVTDSEIEALFSQRPQSRAEKRHVQWSIKARNAYNFPSTVQLRSSYCHSRISNLTHKKEKHFVQQRQLQTIQLNNWP